MACSCEEHRDGLLAGIWLSGHDQSGPDKSSAQLEEQPLACSGGLPGRHPPLHR